MSGKRSVCPACHGEGVLEWHAKDLVNKMKVYGYHRCKVCDLLYLQPTPGPQKIASFYPDDYAVYREPSRTRFDYREYKMLVQLGYGDAVVIRPKGVADRLRRSKPLLDVVPRVDGGRVLDVGCATGEYLLRLKSIGWQCQGVEFSPKAVEIARKAGLEVFLGDLLDAQFAPESFDFVTAHHVIEHIPDPDSLIAEIARITKPDGFVLIRTPNSKALGRRLFGDYWFANDVPRHLTQFSIDSLVRLANKHGLDLYRSYKPVEHKMVLKSLALKRGTFNSNANYSKLGKWLAKLYIPAAKLYGQGDELFCIFKKTAV